VLYKDVSIALTFLLKGTIIHIFGLSTQHTIGIQTRIGSKLSILVENRGRQTFETINDMKGINGDVILDGQILSGWTHWLINIDDAFFARLEQPDAKRMIGCVFDRCRLGYCII
jgi:hypothetical protein